MNKTQIWHCWIYVEGLVQELNIVYCVSVMPSRS